MPVGELCAVLAAMTWAIGSMLFSRVGRTVSPGAMNMGKLVVSGTLLVATYVVLTQASGGSVLASPAVPPFAIALLVASSIIGLTIGDTAYFEAIVSLGVPRAILLLSSAPVFAALGGWLWLDERLDLRSMLGVGVTLSGIALVVLGRPGDGGLPATPRGVAAGLIAGVSQGAGSLLSRRAMQAGIDPLASAAVRVCVGAIALLVFGVSIGKARGWARELSKDRAFLRVGLACLVGSYVGIWLSQVSIARASSTGVASTLMATSPAFALPLAHAFGFERTTSRAAVGVFVTLGGIACLTLRG